MVLPIGSGPFVQHAGAVRDGFLAAAKLQGSAGLPVRVYAATDDPGVTMSGYRQAVAAGARIVVGPLTRASVSALAATNLIPVPTIALNVPDGNGALPERMYALSLQIEAEARLVARFAYEQGQRNAYTIAGTDLLSRRMNEAFVDEFTRLGGTQADGQIYGGDRAELDRYRAAIASSKADVVFLALDAARARAVRSYVGNLPVYGTSQIHPGTSSELANFELNEVRFVGMPWMLQPEHAAVIVYPRRDYGGNLDLQRLYALGIDAYRLAHDLLAGRPPAHLDGVTGEITLGTDRRFRRGLPVAQFSNGGIVVVGEARP